MDWHIAQINIARMRAPLDHPSMAGFTKRLAEINALADSSAGFVWRLESEDGDATSIRAFDDDSLLINLSVWESIEDLRQFVYRTMHRELLAAKTDWFEKMDRAHLALWWVPAGTRPTTEDAKTRLKLLHDRGPTADAFTFGKTFKAP